MLLPTDCSHLHVGTKCAPLCVYVDTTDGLKQSNSCFVRSGGTYSRARRAADYKHGHADRREERACAIQVVAHQCVGCAGDEEAGDCVERPALLHQLSHSGVSWQEARNLRGHVGWDCNLISKHR